MISTKPNNGLARVELPTPVIVSEQKKNTAENSQQQISAAASSTTVKIVNSNANDGNDDDQQVPSAMQSNKNAVKKSRQNHHNSKPVHLSGYAQKEVNNLCTSTSQSITVRAFAAFGKTTEAVQEILYDIEQAKEIASTVAEFKDYVGNANEKFKKLVNKHDQEQLEKAEARRNALIASMQPVSAAEATAREKLTITLQQEFADSLTAIFEQSRQERGDVEQSPAHKKYLADQSAAKVKLEFCENAFTQRKKIEKEIWQELQEYINEFYNIEVCLMIRCKRTSAVVCAPKRNPLARDFLSNSEAEMILVCKSRAEFDRLRASKALPCFSKINFCLRR